MNHTEQHSAAGRKVVLQDDTPFTIEDWNDRVFGQSWQIMGGHPASLKYAMRSAMAGLPLDNEVVYGKDQYGRGRLVHVSEIKAADGAAEA